MMCVTMQTILHMSSILTVQIYMTSVNRYNENKRIAIVNAFVFSYPFDFKIQ